MEHLMKQNQSQSNVDIQRTADKTTPNLLSRVNSTSRHAKVNTLNHLVKQAEAVTHYAVPGYN